MNHFLNIFINANFQFFDVQDSYKIPDRIESAAHKLRHALTSLFRIPARTFESQCIMYHIVFGHQGAIIFILIPAVLGICSTDSFCSRIQTVIQQIEWPASCASTSYFGVDIAYFLQKGDLN
jgi:hypothetical protein